MTCNPTIQITEQMQERCELLWSTHPFFMKLTHKQVSRQQVGAYLLGIGELVKKTPAHLKIAIETSYQAGFLDLSKHLEGKFAEEFGHEIWALNDARSLNIEATLSENDPESKSIGRFVHWILEQAKTDLMTYCGYLYAVEAITVYLGPRLLSLLEDGAGVKRDQATIIAKHVELDIEHTAEMIPWLNLLINSESNGRGQKKTLSAIDRTLTALSELLSEALQSLEAHFELSTL